MAKPNKPVIDVEAKNYKHPEAESPMRPEVGTQANFRKRKAPVTYKYDSSFSPVQRWVNAVNADGTQCLWKFAMARTIGQVRESIDKAV